MANAKVCDRCGTTILPVTIAQKIGLSAWKYGVIDRENCHRTQFDCDLCPECAGKLMKFLNGYGLIDVSAIKE